MSADYKCSLCQEEKATVHITQQGDTEEVEIHLCGSCAERMGINRAVGFSMDDLFSAVKAAEK